jgi:sulfur-carrier protein
VSQPITVQLHAAAREAAGAGSLQVDATTVPGTAELRRALTEAHGATLGRVLQVATLLVDGDVVGPGQDLPLSPGAVVEVLPPFAGG